MLQSRVMIFSLLDSALVVVAVLLWPIRIVRKWAFHNSRLSVWTGVPIINMVMNAKAEQLLGTRTLTVVSHTYFITNKFDFNLRPPARSQRLGFLLQYLACLAICVMADRVHVYVDGGILPQKGPRLLNRTELWLYSLMGLPVFAWTYGADVRTQKVTRALGSPNCCSDCTQVMRACVCDAAVADANYEFVRRHTTAVFSMGDMIEYTPGSCNNLFFWPVDFDAAGGDKYRPAYPDPKPSHSLKVLHAPNHRELKGTRYIERAVSELQAEGEKIELVLIERVPNDVAIEMYKKADIIVDQVLIGFHGYFALEAMALGKPVMCFIRDRKRYLCKPDECPLIDVQLSTLKETLRYWSQADRSLLMQTGRAGRRYIEEHYSLSSFARRLEIAYQEHGVKV